MTDISQLGELETAPLSEEAVVAFLQDNPDFFLHQPDLLARLKIPHAERGTVSLVEIQLSRLRQRVAELEEDITQLMSAGSRNEQLFRAFSHVHRSLFAATSEQDIDTALGELAHSLNLNVCLRVYDEASSPLKHIERKRVDALRASHFAGNRCYFGRLRRVEGELFLSEAPELGSYALVPVVQGRELGMLAFASKDGGHFQPSMDTLFLDQLAEHIAILLSQWQQD